MAKFLQMREPSGTLVNIESIVTVYRDSRTASEQDEGNVLEVKTGEIIYMINFKMLTGGVMTVDFLVKEYRDICYKEIIDVINPVLIGAGIPLKSKDSLEEKANEHIASAPPTPKPPRKTRTPRQ